MSTDKDYLYALRLQDELNGIDDELVSFQFQKLFRIIYSLWLSVQKTQKENT